MSFYRGSYTATCNVCGNKEQGGQQQVGQVGNTDTRGSGQFYNLKPFSNLL